MEPTFIFFVFITMINSESDQIFSNVNIKINLDKNMMHVSNILFILLVIPQKMYTFEHTNII